MLKAIRSIAKGELYYPPYASSVIIRNLIKQVGRTSAEPARESEEATGSSVWKMITPREQQILRCLTEGMSSKDIAEKFDISSNTVANQREYHEKQT
ncbi:LuxR C-terminal-related transcriptional regulator [Paucibacter sp. O1-1]|nr:LuxR C-terminal-related transcriptional regulator [Paucibacter sp. O1-1]MDA3830122.1 LuxR C-terminal-related transcriptional regulator [Paucibacter sp. O1-1]